MLPLQIPRVLDALPLVVHNRRRRGVLTVKGGRDGTAWELLAGQGAATGARGGVAFRWVPAGGGGGGGMAFGKVAVAYCEQYCAMTKLHVVEIANWHQAEGDCSLGEAFWWAEDCQAGE